MHKATTHTPEQLPHTYQAAKMEGWHEGYKRGSEEVLEDVTELLDNVKPEYLPSKLRAYIKRFRS